MPVRDQYPPVRGRRACGGAWHPVPTLTAATRVTSATNVSQGGWPVDVQEPERGRRLVLLGRLDARSAPDVRQSLHRVVDTGTGDLVVDVEGLLLVDVSSLGLFLEAHRRAERIGRRLVLVGVPGPLRRMLRVTRLDRVLSTTTRTPVPEAATA